MKLITIVDCYIHDEISLNKLNLFLDKLNNKNKDVLLISNTTVPIEIQKKVKFCFYDFNNKLFDESFNYTSDCWSNHWSETYTIHEHFYSKQYHGLSVLYNLTNSISLSKSLGYTHFEKIEWDFNFGEETLKNIESLNRICLLNNKKSIFIVNFNTEKPEFRFDYFMSEISFFDKNFTSIKEQNDYKIFLSKNYNNQNFINVEQFLYKNFELVLDDVLLIGNDEIFNLFNDSIVNSEISLNYIPKYFDFCTSRLYKINDGNSYVLLTYNYKTINHYRKIKIIYSDMSEEIIEHVVILANSFVYNELKQDVLKIIVMNENNTIIYEESVENVKNKIMFY
jgi:hypothetical protein